MYYGGPQRRGGEQFMAEEVPAWLVERQLPEGIVLPSSVFAGEIAPRHLSQARLQVLAQRHAQTLHAQQHHSQQQQPQHGELRVPFARGWEGGGPVGSVWAQRDIGAQGGGGSEEGEVSEDTVPLGVAPWDEEGLFAGESDLAEDSDGYRGLLPPSE